MTTATVFALIGVLLLSVGTANASGWVLWSEGYSLINKQSKIDGWRLIEAAPSKDACSAKLANAVEHASQPEAGIEFHVRGGVVEKYKVGVQPSDFLVRTRYWCLPEGLDPPGPKVK